MTGGGNVRRPGLRQWPDAMIPSASSIPARERLILALDLDSIAAARALVAELGETVAFYKLGLSLVFDENFWPFCDELSAQGKKVFADLKLFDVPETVAAGVRQLARRGAAFATVHAHEAMIEAAAGARGGAGLKILAVTVLTSLDLGDVRALGFEVPSVERLVLSRAERALAAGADGVISSGLEAPALRGALGQRPLIVVPGIRPVENKPADDQKRTVDVEDAFRAGADYIVIGRPITRAPDPRAAAEAVQARIAQQFGAC
jgi:orotidine-5'-phosphate decarboxylase